MWSISYSAMRKTDIRYFVWKMMTERVTCVGNFNFISEGELMELSGEYTNHSVYGTQLKVSSHHGEGTGGSCLDRAISRFRSHQRRGSRHWPAELSKSSGRIHSGSLKKSRSAWRRSRGSASGRQERSQSRWKRKRTCARR